MKFYIKNNRRPDAAEVRFSEISHGCYTLKIVTVIVIKVVSVVYF
jgi:hypothetical protein